MTTKTLIAAAAVAAALTAAVPAQQAAAKTNIDININVGDGYGHHHNHYRPAVSCHQGARVVSRDGFMGVYPVDCRLPGYRYVGWRWGRQYVVSVNSYGAITNVRRAY
jgi:hypothetical protein